MFRSLTHGAPGPTDLVLTTCFDDLEVPAFADPAVQEAVRRPGFKGELRRVVEARPASGPTVLVAGLGPRARFDQASWRVAAAALARKASELRARVVQAQASGLEPVGRSGQTLGEVFGALAWRSTEYRGSQAKLDDLADVGLTASDEEFDRGVERGLALAASANWARTLAFTPPNVATPDWMASQAEGLRALGLHVRVLRGSELEEERLAGLITVGRASVNPPCLIRVEYRPDGVSGDPVVLLGKTVTYDTGGLAIKPREGMRGMKGDKSGGCAVLGAMHAVATVVRPPLPVVGLLVAAENSVSGDAFRNDDVMTFRNGVTVEVTNTDAEGRLVLADGLCWAYDNESPRCVVDLATLTGGVVVALGSVYAGYWATDEALGAGLTSAAEETGERLWRLPLHREYVESMKSEIADLVNSVASRGAHPVMGATFLSQFVPEGAPWAHIDIAGVASTDRDKDGQTPGPTGFGVRLLAEWLGRGGLG